MSTIVRTIATLLSVSAACAAGAAPARGDDPTPKTPRPADVVTVSTGTLPVDCRNRRVVTVVQTTVVGWVWDAQAARWAPAEGVTRTTRTSSPATPSDLRRCPRYAGPRVHQVWHLATPPATRRPLG